MLVRATLDAYVAGYTDRGDVNVARLNRLPWWWRRLIVLVLRLAMMWLRAEMFWSKVAGFARRGREGRR